MSITIANSFIDVEFDLIATDEVNDIALLTLRQTIVANPPICSKGYRA